MNQQNENGYGNVPATTGVPIFVPAAPEQPVLNEAETDTLGNEEQEMAKEPFPAVERDTVFSILLFLCGIFFIYLVFETALGLGVTLFFLLYTAVSFSYLHCKGKPLPKGVWPCLVLSCLSAMNFAMYTNWELRFFNLIFLMGCILYETAVLCGSRIEDRLGGFFVADLFNQAFCIPFSNFFSNFRAMSANKSRRSKSVWAVLGGIVVAIPLLAFIISQLVQADDLFRGMVNGFVEGLSRDFGGVLWRLVFSLLVACYLFGLLFGNLHHYKTKSVTREKAERARTHCQKLPLVLSITTLVLVCAVYVLFFAAQAVGLYQTFTQNGQDGFSYSQYAREGFFELCRVSFFNLLLMGGAWLFTRMEEGRSRSRRVLFALLSVETLLLIATAAAKMLLYIGQYGLTQKRIYTMWFMGVLFLVFCVAMAAQFRPLPVLRSLTAVFCVSFLLLCYGNVDGMIVHYNVGRFESGTLEELDFSSLSAAPEAAIPRAAALYETLPEGDLKERLGSFLVNAKENLLDTDWRNQSIQSLIATNTKLPQELAARGAVPDAKRALG